MKVIIWQARKAKLVKGACTHGPSEVVAVPEDPEVVTDAEGSEHEDHGEEGSVGRGSHLSAAIRFLTIRTRHVCSMQVAVVGHVVTPYIKISRSQGVVGEYLQIWYNKL